MPRRPFFRTLSGTFSNKQQQQEDSKYDGQALKRRPSTVEAGGAAAPSPSRRRASYVLRPKEPKQAALTAAALDVRFFIALPVL